MTFKGMERSGGMLRFTVLFVGLLCFRYAIGTSVSTPSTNVRIDAGITLYKYIYLITGDTIIPIYDAAEQPSANITQIGLPAGESVGAAWISKDQRVIYGYGKSNGWAVTDDGGLTTKTIPYGKRRPFLFNYGEPDAAVRRPYGKVFFKDCQMAVRREWDQWDDPIELLDGVPCPLDAAWRNPDDDDEAHLLQYDQVWTWFANGTITGPVNINSMFTFTTNTLEPHPNPPPSGTFFLAGPES